MSAPICPKCGPGTIIGGAEYAYDDPNHYDGVSEWRCESCATRWGRWSGRILRPDDRERRFGR